MTPGGWGGLLDLCSLVGVKTPGRGDDDVMASVTVMVNVTVMTRMT